MTDDHEFGHEVHDLKEDLWLTPNLETNQPRKGPDKPLGTHIRSDWVLSCSVDPGCHPISFKTVLSGCD